MGRPWLTPDANFRCFCQQVPEQVEYLQQHVVRIAVGTPNRLAKLVEEGTAPWPAGPPAIAGPLTAPGSWRRTGALHLDALSLVVLDCWVDQKERTLVEIPEVRGDLVHFLDDHCRERMLAGKTRLVLY